jgi:aspartate kinase
MDEGQSRKTPSVFKFGGTSVGDGVRFRWVAAIVAKAASQTDTIPIVVVSAMAGVTDALLRIARLSCSGRREAALAEQAAPFSTLSCV